MKRATKPSQRDADIPRNTFILDNGAYTLDAGFAPTAAISDEDILSSHFTIPNCIVRTRDRKTYIAAQVDEVTQWSEAVFRRPIEHGQLVNWEAQKEIWEKSFFDERTAKAELLIERPEETTLVLTEAPNTIPALQKNVDEVVMEEWGFGAYSRVIGASLNAFNDLHPVFEEPAREKEYSTGTNSPMDCLLVVDSGYSYTTVTPVFKGRPLQRAIRRLDFGGKHMTNLLKEIISVRHFDLQQDTKIVNDIKEDVCYVSRDFRGDLEKTWKGNRGKRPVIQSNEDDMDVDEDQTRVQSRIDYILPDGVHIVRGFTRPYDPSAAAIRKRKLGAMGSDSTEVSMTLGNERFSVPEIIFNPSDIGSKQPGLPDCVIQSLSVLPPLIQATMFANILVVGGNANMPNFAERLQDDLRCRVRTDWAVRVRKMDNPVSSTWLGGARLASLHPKVLREYAITKAEYMEHGTAWAFKKFASGGK